MERVFSASSIISMDSHIHNCIPNAHKSKEKKRQNWHTSYSFDNVQTLSKPDGFRGS